MMRYKRIWQPLWRIMTMMAVALIVATPALAGGGMSSHGRAMNFRHDLGPQEYHFQVDISDDVFVNQQRFRMITGGMDFVDENGDGICDLAQDSGSFRALGLGPFQDENGDGIFDGFQTRNAYQALGMNNFVDVDGDGLCDNYEAVPRAGE